ncbi:LysR family transcriptional regulator [Meridianimarinicoccus roseus]|jgi:DNA-binding transcriptional LysR family regulator|uniref:LysR family transcriptional regulator n=1 Tax=Meridianimarinicoccus roseus TaxID=2072018 RepID=A0A2V2L6D4_9RHOB|nr:LysR family transcriptional regulator [Meridianimarinicoccus roseus]PWR00952.1 LysR family transcriptional regulator [Meridianimarinicoccus roseus]
MNWNDAKYFLAVAREGQMLGAARRLGVSQARLSRRIAALETALGTTLLDRGPQGCALTGPGTAMLPLAERAEAAMLEAEARLSDRAGDIAGSVRIGAPDGFGAGFLAARLDRFTQAYPSLDLQLVPVPRTFSLSQREADIAIMIDRPARGRLRARKLTDYTLGLYAAQAYLDRAGTPTELADLAAHRLIGYVDDLIFTQALNYTGEFLPGWHSSIEISTALGQFEAVKAGAGIGILHDFMAAGVPGLVPLFPTRSLSRSYWTVWHENQRSARPVRAAVDLLDTLARENRRLFVRAADTFRQPNP